MALRYLWQTTRAPAVPGRGARRRGARSLAAFTWTFSWRLTPSTTPSRHAFETGSGEARATEASPSLAPGDLHSFEAFFREHERAIFTYLYRITGDEQTAYDLSQETFVRAWQRYERIRGYERPVAWLFRVATNLALNERRNRTSPARNTVALDGEHDPASSDHAWRTAERDAIREALQAMPTRQRAALVLREVYGLSGEEVAAALSVSHAAAKMLLSRAREQFRRYYSAKEEPR